MCYRLRKRLTVMSVGQPVPDIEEDEDDDVEIGWPVAMLIDSILIIVVVTVLVAWAGCSSTKSCHSLHRMTLPPALART